MACLSHSANSQPLRGNLHANATAAKVAVVAEAADPPSVPRCNCFFWQSSGWVDRLKWLTHFCWGNLICTTRQTKRNEKNLICTKESVLTPMFVLRSRADIHGI